VGLVHRLVCLLVSQFCLVGSVASGYMVCFTRQIVEVQGDSLRRSPSAVELAPTPRYVVGLY